MKFHRKFPKSFRLKLPRKDRRKMAALVAVEHILRNDRMPGY